MQRITIYEDVFVRMCWTDYSGIPRARVVPCRQLLNSMPERSTIMNNGIRLYELQDFDAVQKMSSVGKYGIGITEACLVLMPTADCFPDHCGLGSAREVRLFPDWAKLKAFELEVPLPFLGKSKEQSFCYVPSFLKQNDGSDWPFCPRTILANTLRVFREKTGGMEVMIGVEHEFVLMDAQTKQPIAGDQTYCSALQYDRTSLFLERLERVLHSVGVKVEQVHAESAPGQFEIPVKFKTASETADDVGLFRNVVHVLAQLYGMDASFCPKLDTKTAGSGFHCHVSLWKDNDIVTVASPDKRPSAAIAPRVQSNVFMTAAEDEHPSRSEMTDIGAQFLAGVNHRLHEIMLITSASPLSFQRVQPGTWSGAYAVWGYENRECPLRVLRVGQNFEFKLMDPSANTHLAFAAIIGAGLQGILNHEVLPAPVTCDPHQIYLSHAKARKKNSQDQDSEAPVVPMVSRLPQSLEELLAVTNDFPHLTHVLGRDVVHALVAARKKEHQMARDDIMKYASDWTSLFNAYRSRY